MSKKINPNDYNSALDKLFLFAKDSNISTEYIKKDELNMEYAVSAYIPLERLILINEDDTTNIEYFIYVLAHELGHSIDCDSMSKSELKTHLEIIINFNNTLEMKLDFIPGMSKYIIETERIACYFGEQLLYDLDIKSRKRKITTTRARCLRSYSELFTEFLNQKE